MVDCVGWSMTEDARWMSLEIASTTQLPALVVEAGVLNMDRHDEIVSHCWQFVQLCSLTYEQIGE